MINASFIAAFIVDEIVVLHYIIYKKMFTRNTINLTLNFFAVKSHSKGIKVQSSLKKSENISLLEKGELHSFFLE